MGLVHSSGLATEKLEEIANFVEMNNLQVIGISEADLPGPRSRINRQHPMSLSIIHEELKILLHGYSIQLPETWNKHDQACLLIYLHEVANFEIIKPPTNLQDIPAKERVGTA